MPDAKEILMLFGLDLLVCNQFTPLKRFLWLAFGWTQLQTTSPNSTDISKELLCSRPYFEVQL